MTNNYLHVICNTNPLDPMMFVLLGLRIISITIALASIITAIFKLTHGKSVRIVANINILAGISAGICSIGTILWMHGRALEIVIRAEAESDALGKAISFL